MSAPQRKVLIVDDDAALRATLAGMLTSEGWSVRSAADGSDALPVLRSWRPDVILLDLNMPGMDGWGLCAELARRTETATIPIIVTTVGPLVHAEAERLGVAGALAKPFGFDDLMDSLGRLVG